MTTVPAGVRQVEEAQQVQTVVSTLVFNAAVGSVQNSASNGHHPAMTAGDPNDRSAEHNLCSAVSSPRSKASESRSSYEFGAGWQQAGCGVSHSAGNGSASVSEVGHDTEQERRYPGAPFCTIGERLRLAEMHKMGLEKHGTEARFDEITSLISKLLDCPIGLVDIIDHELMYVKGKTGWGDMSHTGDRRMSICTWTFIPLEPEALVVEDLQQDGRFRDHPIVADPGGPQLRFFAGVPLVTSSGQRLGALCVVDQKPRAISAEACTLVMNYAELIVCQLEEQYQQQQQAIDNNIPNVTPLMPLLPCPAHPHKQQPARGMRVRLAARSFVALVDTRTDDWTILDCTTQFAQVVGCEALHVVARGLWSLVTPCKGKNLALHRQITAANMAYHVNVKPLLPEGFLGTICMDMRPAGIERIFADDMPYIRIAIPFDPEQSSSPPIPSVRGLYFAMLSQTTTPRKRSARHS